MNRMDCKNLIIIGSTARKAGKTSYILKLLEGHPNQYVAIKIQTSLHYDKIEIFKENVSGNENDTQKYLSHFANEAYLIKCPSEKIKEAFKMVYDQLALTTEIICESTTLIKHVIPKKFILFRKRSPISEKKDIDLLMSLADEVIDSD